MPTPKDLTDRLNAQ